MHVKQKNRWHAPENTDQHIQIKHRPPPPPPPSVEQQLQEFVATGGGIGGGYWLLVVLVMATVGIYEYMSLLAAASLANQVTGRKVAETLNRHPQHHH